MRTNIDKSFPGQALESQHGGSALWIKGPAGLDSRKLAEELLKEGVLIEPGDVYYYPKKDKCEFFRLGFSSLPEDKIATGIEKIVDKIKQLT